MSITCKNKECEHFESYDDCVFKEIDCICAEEASEQVKKLTKRNEELEARIERLKSCLNCNSKNECNSWKITETMACINWQMKGE